MADTQTQKKVDFFIIGAPKCGTTALARNLEKNPSIVISKPKEPHYFTTDFHRHLEKPKDDEGYHNLYFPPEKTKGERWGEGSVWTMMSDLGLARIKEYNPDARIIAMLRDPAKAAFSLHQMLVFQQHENVRDFTKAWKLSDQRFAKKNLPEGLNRDHRFLAYKQVYSFLPQIRKIYAHFPPEQVLILTQEEYFKGGVETLKRVDEFLGLEPFEYPQSEKVNKSLYMKNGILMEILRTEFVIKSISRLKRILGIRSFGMGRPSARMSKEEADMVYAELAADMAEVEREFGIRLAKQDRPK